MKRIDLQNKQCTCLKGSPASLEHCSSVINEDTQVYYENHLIAVYKAKTKGFWKRMLCKMMLDVMAKDTRAPHAVNLIPDKVLDSLSMLMALHYISQLYKRWAPYVEQPDCDKAYWFHGQSKNYHQDSIPKRDTWSTVMTFREHIKEAVLVLPEYNIGFEMAHGTVLMFDGQILHGVTPIIKKQYEGAYRLTLVFYS